jgi:hypothetical protein
MLNFNEILNKHIAHSMILDRDGVIKAMAECYNLGVNHSAIKFDKLKNTFEDVPPIAHNQFKKDSGLIESGK